MHRKFIATATIVAVAAVAAVAVILANTRIAQGVIPVTAYEADVNKDGRINVADLGHVASRSGKPVPTATAVLPTPTPGLAWRTYSVGAFWPSEYSYQVWCDWGDRILTPSSGNTTILSETNFENGMVRWGAMISTPGSYAVSVYCFDEYPYHDPLASYCFSVYSGTNWVTHCTLTPTPTFSVTPASITLTPSPVPTETPTTTPTPTSTATPTP